MWPRLVAQLVELLPHATRLLPLADNYFATRRETDRAQAAAVAEMSSSVREEIGRISESSSGLARQLAEQKQQIAALQQGLDVAETHRITQTKQLEWISNDVNALRVWVKFGTVVIMLLLGVVLALTIQLIRLR